MRLSPSKLNVLNDCPRCFWDANVKGVERPRGIFPSLPAGIDRVLKDYFDQYRGSLPLELQGKVTGILFQDQATLKKWRNWRSGLTLEDKNLDVTMIGALDDCLVTGETYGPLDYKTKGSEPKTDGSEYYQAQMDCYALMLEANGYKPSGKATLVYYWPISVQCTLGMISKGLTFGFESKVYELQADPNRARALLEKAVKILKGPRPEPSSGCEYCTYVGTKGAIDNEDHPTTKPKHQES